MIEHHLHLYIAKREIKGFRTRVIYIAKPDIFGETLLQRCCNVCLKRVHCNIPEICQRSN